MTKNKRRYTYEKTREKISITLSSAQMDKATNIKYNQEDYLDEFIVNNMSNTKKYSSKKEDILKSIFTIFYSFY